MPGTMTHNQFINKPVSKTSKDYKDRYNDVQSAYQLVYRRHMKLKAMDLPDENVCVCGTLTSNMSKHLKTARHFTNIIKNDLKIF